jgi:uncharacterized protein YbbK (DUF523 family)
MQDSKTPVLVSACLLGVRCRYDGGACSRDAVLELARQVTVVPVCPEQLGGLATPRPAAEIESGTGEEVLAGKAAVLDEEGKDLSEAFLKGAAEALALAKLTGCRSAVLKERSPSCGVREIVREGEKHPGPGITAALLAREGLRVLGDETPHLAKQLLEPNEADT